LSHPEPSPDPSNEPAAIFRRDGEELVPSLFARGPWNPDHLHGGPICGALARAIESCASPVPMRVVRMTVEMTRAVPMAPFSAHAEVTRAGRRIQQIDAHIAAEGKTLVRATALSMRSCASPRSATSQAPPATRSTSTRFTSINPDLSLHVLRAPRGEWIGLRGRSGIEADGIGQSAATLFDGEGAVGRALVSLLVERR
jgi:hypothetical protein